MLAVIDTNILVSALWRPAGNAYTILSNVIVGRIVPCYDTRIMEEYAEVLLRPKFQFSREQVKAILDVFAIDGISVIPEPLKDAEIKDTDDLPFYEVAKFCNAPLITGNVRDFPEDPIVITPADFCERYLN